MKLAVEVWSADAEQVIATARRAESLGLDGFRYGESPTALNLDCWTMLAALARETARIRIGPVITNLLPDYRSVALLAKQAATVALLSDGRLDLATGAGAAAHYGRAWWEPFGIDYPAYDERLAELTRTLPELRRLWADGLRFDCPTIPITLAAVGDRAMAVAAAEADVWEASFRTPAEYAALADRFAELTPSASTRPVTRALEIDGFIGTTTARADAVVAGAIQDRRAEDTDRILDRALVGPPARVAEHMAELAEVGVEQLLVALHGPHDPDALEALAEARALL